MLFLLQLVTVHFIDGIRDVKDYILVVGGVTCCCFFIFWVCLALVSKKVVYELKWRYMKAVLTQEAEWYEARRIEELPTQINTALSEVEMATGKTLGCAVYCLFNVVGGLAISFYVGATMALSMLVIIVYILVWGAFQSYAISKGDTIEDWIFIKSGASAEQALTAIKVVKAFGQEQHEVYNFERHLSKYDHIATKQAWLYGVGKGVLESSLYLASAYGFFIGGIFVASEVSDYFIFNTPI